MPSRDDRPTVAAVRLPHSPPAWLFDDAGSSGNFSATVTTWELQNRLGSVYDNDEYERILVSE